MEQKHKTCTLRRSLYVNMAVYIVLAAGAVMVIFSSRTSQVLHRMSQELIFRTTNEVEMQLSRLFEPVNSDLETLLEWGVEGRLSVNESMMANHLLVPFVANSPQVHSLVVADEQGRSRTLIKLPGGWQSRLCDPFGNVGGCRIVSWKNENPREKEESWEEPNFDARKRPWFRGAMALLEAQVGKTGAQRSTVYWTDPYEFYTDHEPGITGAIAFLDDSGKKMVVALDVKLSGIMEFTNALTLSDEGMAFVCTDSGVVLGRPRYTEELSQPSVSQWLEEVHNLDLPEPAMVMAQRGKIRPDRRANFFFRSSRGRWRATVRPFPLGENRRFWIGVAMPETELMPDLRWRLMTILMVVSTVLVLAMLSARHISRRYSSPLDILLSQSQRIALLDLRPMGVVHSRYREVDQLSHAMESMRMALEGAIAKQEAATEALRDSEARSSGILEAASEAIITINDDDLVDSINPAGVEMFGYSEEKFIGKPIAELLEPEEVDHYRGYLDELRKEEGEDFHGKRLELTALHRDGSTFPVAVSLSRVNIGGKRFFTALVTNVSDKKYIDALRQNYRRALERDVAERTRRLREKHEALEKTLADLQEAQSKLIAQEKLASLGSLTAGIAHEIKNPLNFVNNFADVTLELIGELKEILLRHQGTLDAEEEQDLADLFVDIEANMDKIGAHGKRADSIVQGMLAHSRGKAGEFQVLPLNELVEEDVQLAYHGMRARDAQFYTKIELNFDPLIGAVPVVPQNFGRVILNLVNNACQSVYRKKGQAGDKFAAVVRVSTLLNGDWVELRVWDNGLGISPEVQEKVFEPFFTTKEVGEGTGLGLSICYNTIVDEHGGEMWVESEQGLYAEFVVRIPRQRVSVQES